mgnify:CR=1 FL=1
MPSQSIVLSTAYFAPAAYYADLIHYPHVLIEQHEHFIKQSYRNRCEILGANGKLSLSIPLQERKNKALTCDIRIDSKTPWQMQHWRAIESAYNSSPFFEYYQDDFLPFYQKQFEFLIDFNHQLQEKMLELIGCKVKIEYSKAYCEIIEGIQIDARNAYSPKQICKKQFPEYIQVFESKFPFHSNLSILDVLFNLGNESEIYLKSIASPE